jgi:hypothetical protein
MFMMSLPDAIASEPMITPATVMNMSARSKVAPLSSRVRSSRCQRFMS